MAKTVTITRVMQKRDSVRYDATIEHIRGIAIAILWVSLTQLPYFWLIGFLKAQVAM